MNARPVNADRSPPAGSLWAIGVQPWAEFALILAIFFIVGGAPAPHVNETHYLTKAKHYWDASYCPGDFFLDSADPHLVFYWSFGWVTQFFSLTATAWIGRVLAWALLAAGWLRLARAVVPTPWAATLSAAVWLTLIEWNNFAGEWVVGGVEAKCFAYGLVLFGLAAMVRGEWRSPWLWFGAASAFHVLVGAWAVLGAMAVWLTEPRAQQLSLRAMWPVLLVGGVLSLPGLMPAVALERGTDPAIAAEAARIYVFDRLPHHLAPLSLPKRELQTRLMRFAPVVAAFVGVWAWWGWQRRCRGVETDHTIEASNAVRRLLNFATFALVASGVGLVIEAALVDRPLVAARVLRYYWFRQVDVVVPMAVAVVGLHALFSGWRRKIGVGDASHRLNSSHKLGSRLRTAGIGAVLALGGWFLASTAWKRLDEPRPPAVARMVRYQDWQDACRWISEHTPAKAVFLTPRAGHSFKWYASRADVANYKDVPQDAASVVEWKRRCEELFPTVGGVGGQPTMLSSPDLWGARRMRELAHKYGATHVIARTYPPLDLPVLYPRGDEGAGSYYTVYEIPASRESDAR